jgi:hypothetical protein
LRPYQLLDHRGLLGAVGLQMQVMIDRTLAERSNVADKPRLMRTARVLSTSMFAAHRAHSIDQSAKDSSPA